MSIATNDTAQKIAELLQENTGRHSLDSGGAYGRHWERNQGSDFENQPSGHLEVCTRDGELNIIPTLSVYHFLKDRLEYNSELDQRFRDYVEQEGLDFAPGSSEAFAETLGATGLYGEGNPVSVNTYNGEDLLSQTLQYVYWTDGEGSHLLLQIHGGCDVRGGYTDPVAFDVDESIFGNARATIVCDACRANWSTDDATHWYPEGYCGQGYKQLETYPATDSKPITSDVGVVWVDNGNMYCPHCGGVLYLTF